MRIINFCIFFLLCIIIIIIISRWNHGYPWPSLATPPYRTSLQAGLQDNIPYPHIAAECMFVLVVLLLHGHVWGSIRVHFLWVRPCFSRSVCIVSYYSVLFLWLRIISSLDDEKRKTKSHELLPWIFLMSIYCCIIQHFTFCVEYFGRLDRRFEDMELGIMWIYPALF